MNHAQSRSRVRNGENIGISPVVIFLNQSNVISIHDMRITRGIFYCDEFRHNRIVA